MFYCFLAPNSLRMSHSSVLSRKASHDTQRHHKWRPQVNATCPREREASTNPGMEKKKTQKDGQKEEKKKFKEFKVDPRLTHVEHLEVGLENGGNMKSEFHLAPQVSVIASLFVFDSMNHEQRRNFSPLNEIPLWSLASQADAQEEVALRMTCTVVQACSSSPRRLVVVDSSSWLNLVSWLAAAPPPDWFRAITCHKNFASK